MSGSSTRQPRSGAACDPKLLRALERIAHALEQNTEAQLMLLDELTSDPDRDEQGDGSTYLDGSSAN